MTDPTPDAGWVRNGPVLVIGASGFVGRHAAEAIEDSGRSVVRASRSGDEADVSCDLTRPGEVSATLEQIAPVTVVMAAGVASGAAAWNDPAAVFRVNTGGVFNLLEANRNRPEPARLLIASSGAVYDRPKAQDRAPRSDAPVTGEDSPVRPASPYAASKLAAELLCRQFSAAHDMGITVARIFNQIGPGQGAGQAVSEFAREIALAESRGEPGLELEVGNPRAERDYLDVRDTARALAAMLDRELSGTFNVCSGRTLELGSLVEGLAAATRLEVGIWVKPERAHPVDPDAAAGANRRLVEETGWRPEIRLKKSLADLLSDWRRRV